MGAAPQTRDEETEDRYAGLPGVLVDVATVAGVRAALELAAEFGGRRLYIPKRMHVDHPIARAIGMEAAPKLAALWPAERVLIPLGPCADGARKRAHIRKLLDGGRSVTEIVRALRCHERTVYRVKRSGGGDPLQSDLFDK